MYVCLKLLVKAQIWGGEGLVIWAGRKTKMVSLLM